MFYLECGNSSGSLGLLISTGKVINLCNLVDLKRLPKCNPKVALWIILGKCTWTIFFARLFTCCPCAFLTPFYKVCVLVRLEYIITDFPNWANSAHPSPTTTILHIFVIHRPNFEESGRIFEVVMNGQAFYKAKRRDRWREKEIRINLKMIPHIGGERGKRKNPHDWIILWMSTICEVLNWWTRCTRK